MKRFLVLISLLSLNSFGATIVTNKVLTAQETTNAIVALMPSGGAATNAVATIEKDGSPVGLGVTNINFITGTNIHIGTLNETGKVSLTISTPGSMSASANNILSGSNYVSGNLILAKGPYVNVKDFGAVGDANTDNAVAIQNAIRAAATNGTHTVFFPNGIYNVSNSLDCTSVITEHPYYRAVNIIGESMENTIIRGGTNGYPILDFTGSRSVRMADITIATFASDGISPSCGILLGRMSTDNGGADSKFDRVRVMGSFTVADVCSIAAEVVHWNDCKFDSMDGTESYANFYHARTTNSYYGPIVSKFRTITTDGLGGNSVDLFTGCSFNYYNGLAADTAKGANFVTEYPQALTFIGCFFYVGSGQTNQFIIRDTDAVDITFIGTRFEWVQASQPYFYLSGANKVKGLLIQNSQIPPILADDNSEIHGLNFITSDWNSTNTGIKVLDVPVLVDSSFQVTEESGNMPGWEVNDGIYHVRTKAERVNWGGIPISRLSGAATNQSKHYFTSGSETNKVLGTTKGGIQLNNEHVDEFGNLSEVLFSVGNPPTLDLRYAFVSGIYQGWDSGYASGDLIFGTRDIGSTNISERMRINYLGNIGIGKTNPAVKLDVVGSIVASGNFIGNGSLLSNVTSSVNLPAPTNTPAAGQALTATSTNSSAWATIAGSGDVLQAELLDATNKVYNYSTNYSATINSAGTNNTYQWGTNYAGLNFRPRTDSLFTNTIVAELSLAIAKPSANYPLDVLGVGNFQHVYLKQDLTDSADRRNWALRREISAYGDLGLYVSSSNTGDPDIPALYLTRNKVLYANGSAITNSSGNSIVFAGDTVGMATNAAYSTNFVGQLNVSNYNNGTSASGSTYLRGDGTWAMVTATGGSTNLVDKSAGVTYATNTAVAASGTTIAATEISNTNGANYVKISGGDVVASGMFLGLGANNSGPSVVIIPKTVSIFEEFFGQPSSSALLGPLGFASSGSVFQYAGESDAPGLVNMSTGTSSSGLAMVLQRQANMPIITSGGNWTNQWRIRIPTLATEAEDFVIRVGMSSSTGATEGNEACYVRIPRTGNMLLVVRKVTNETTADLGAAPSANTWLTLRIIILGTTAAYVSVNGAAPVALQTTSNIPTGAMALNATILKSAGTTARTLDVDYCWLGYSLTSSR